MSVYFNSDSYNKRTFKRISNLLDKVNGKINVANITFIDSSLIDFSTSDTRYEYDNMASINGVRVSSINEMLNYLKTNKTSLQYIERDFSIYENKMEYNIEIPDGFDGRNGFVYVGFNSKSTSSGSALFRSYRDMATETNLHFNRYDGKTNDYHQTFFVSQTKRNVKITCNQMKPDTRFNGNITTVHVTILLWRFV